MIVLDPRLKKTSRMVTPAPRLKTLEGKRVGILWNNRLGGDRLLKHVGKLLQEQHGVSEIYFTKKTFVGNAAPGEVLNDIVSRVDAAICGVGD